MTYLRAIPRPSLVLVPLAPARLLEVAAELFIGADPAYQLLCWVLWRCGRYALLKTARRSALVPLAYIRRTC